MKLISGVCWIQPQPRHLYRVYTLSQSRHLYQVYTPGIHSVSLATYTEYTYTQFTLSQSRHLHWLYTPGIHSDSHPYTQAVIQYVWVYIHPLYTQTMSKHSLKPWYIRWYTYFQSVHIHCTVHLWNILSWFIPDMKSGIIHAKCQIHL